MADDSHVVLDLLQRVARVRGQVWNSVKSGELKYSYGDIGQVWNSVKSGELKYSYGDIA